MVPEETSLWCPYCNKHTAVTPAPLQVLGANPQMPSGIGYRPAPDGDKRPCYVYGSAVWWIGKCNACRKPMLVRNSGAEVYPTPQPEPVSVDVPEPMRSDLTESKLCLYPFAVPRP
jgi:hypothetical protein